MGAIKKHLVSLLFIIAVSVWCLWPILKNPAKRTADPWDGVLMVWYLNQTINKIPGSLGSLFQGNIFYPYNNTMAYSDMHILSAVVSYLPVKITSEPVVAIGSSLLFGQIATMFVLYLWFYQITKSKSASLLTSCLLCFSSVRMGFLVHLQMWNIQWFLLSSFLFYQYIKNKRRIYSYLSFFLLGLQLWESPLGVFFGGFTMGLIAIFNLPFIKKNYKTLLLSFAIFFITVFPPAFSYFSVSREFNYVRTIRDAAHFSLGLDEIIKSIVMKPVFAVFVFSLYVLRKKITKDKEVIWALLMIISAFVLTLGPVLKWAGKTVKILSKIFIPLPYSLIYYLVPGFKAFRTPARWSWLIILGLSFVIAIGLAKYFKNKKISNRKKFFAVLVVVILSLLGGKVENYFEFQKVSEYPKVYSVLKVQPPGVLLELPAYSWAAGEIAAVETHRMVYSLFHNKYLLGGFSGFNPPSWDRMITASQLEFPSAAFESMLKESGVDYVIVWKDLYNGNKLNQIQEWGMGKIVYEDNKHVLLSLNGNF